MSSSRAVVSVSILTALSGTAAFAQTVISAHSGLIHYVEGRVLLNGNPVEVKITSFPEVKVGMELRTEDGRFKATFFRPDDVNSLGKNVTVAFAARQLSPRLLLTAAPKPSFTVCQPGSKPRM